ncbi:hypothetical protein FGO68_gene5152 [Halteria grandinella]|uniref:AAA+ ATPase domain-containing protein n=1 Tax=Halteria grandinella TaxID=5974 RepID=A0A8J8P0A2_HALGN|nr:hypothetical protein FGO68_gene5152 [Halteria grandinella]
MNKPSSEIIQYLDNIRGVPLVQIQQMPERSSLIDDDVDMLAQNVMMHSKPQNLFGAGPSQILTNTLSKTNKQIQIITSNREIYGYLKGDINKDLPRIMFNALAFFHKMRHQERTCSLYYVADKQQHSVQLFKRIIAVRQYAGGNSGQQQIPLLDNEFNYEVYPNSVSIIFQNMDDLMLLEAKFVEINQVEIIFDENLEASLDRPELRPQAPQKKKDQYFKEQERAQRSFYKFLLYFIEEQVCYPQLVREDLKKAKELICQKFIGCSKFLDKFSKKLDIFSSSIYPSSKGILLFGPPGTGKSAITNAFCEASGFRYVCTPLAAGELKKGIVGDSQRTINEMRARANLVPWDLLFCLIDEIDCLVPDRNSSNASNSDSDLISVILSTMDGVNCTPNLKFVASTNHLSKMDDAFLRRMEIQLFLGNPSMKDRRQWIKSKYLDDSKKYETLKIDELEKQTSLKKLHEVCENKEIQNFIVSSTINFSADNMRKLLQNFYHKVLTTERRPLVEWQKILKDFIKDLSTESKNYLGTQTTADIFDNEENYRRFTHSAKFEKFLKFAQDEQSHHQIATKRMVINLGATKENIGECIQIETFGKINNNQQLDHFYEMLQQAQQNSESFIGIAEQNLHSSYKILIAGITIFDNIEINFGDNTTKSIYELIHKSQQQVLIQNFFYSHPDSFVNYLTATRKLDEYGEHSQKLSRLFEDLEGLIRRDSRETVDPRKVFQQFMQNLYHYWLNKPKIQYCGSFTDIEYLKRAWLWQILKFSQVYDADSVILMDNRLLQDNNANEDAQAANFIQKKLQEVQRYDRPVIIIDFDSLALNSLETSGMKEIMQHASLYAMTGGNNQSTHSYQTQRPQTLQILLKLFSQVKKDSNCWIIAVCSSPKLLLDLTTEACWQKSPSVLQFERQEAEENELRLCVVCGEQSTIKLNNQEMKCKVHNRRNEVFLETPSDQPGGKPNKKYMTYMEAQKMIKDHTIVNNLMARDKLVVDNYMFKYRCCNQPLESKGETSAYHVFR